MEGVPKQGVPCVLKRRKGVLILEIENYGVVNVSDEKCLKGLCTNYTTKKHHKHHHKAGNKTQNVQEKPSKETKNEIKQEKNEKKEKQPQEVEVVQPEENIKKPHKMEEKDTQFVKEKEAPKLEGEKIADVVENDKENDMDEESPQILPEQNLEVGQDLVETKTDHQNDNGSEQPGKKLKKVHPIPRDTKKPAKAKVQQKSEKKIEMENKETPQERHEEELNEEEEEERVNFVAERGMLTNGTNDLELDKQIAKGYLYVNTGKMQDAIKHFDQLLKAHPELIAGYLGRGSARAMSGDLKRALTDFDKAVKINAKCADAYKRRGQVKAALGNVNGALDDFTQAIKLSPEEADSYRQRGSLFHSLGVFDKASDDLKKSLKYAPGDAQVINELALCFNGMGLVDEAINAYTRAINAKENYADPYIHLGQLYRDMGCYIRSKQMLEKAMKLAPTNHLSYYVLGNVLVSSGRHREALPFLQKSIELCPKDNCGEIVRMCAAAYLALGQNRLCLQMSKLGSEAKDNASWYYGELAKYSAMMLDKKFLEYDIEWFPSQWKVNFAKRLPNTNVTKYPTGTKLQPITTPDIEAKDSIKQDLVMKLLSPAVKIGEKMQYNEIGFGKNGRQYLCCGLASIYYAQLLKSGERPEWRDLAEIVVKFRQIAEPADGAIWINKLTKQQFEDGFGSNTTLKTAQTRVARYWPMFPRTFALFKKLFTEQTNFPADKKERVNATDDVDEVRKIINRDNYYMTTICRNEAGDKLEGTWLLIEKSELGSMFSIKTPCLPKRFNSFDKELKSALDKFYTVIDSKDKDKVLDAVLRYCYLWFNFMPLTRGTAACGMYFLFGLLLSAGFKQVGTIPQSFQCDWEALLTETQNEYIVKMKTWIKLEEFDVLQLPRVLEVLPNYRDVIMALNISPLLVPLC
ncbi:tetratricopeptide repeat protein, tpr, putative [Entamoeba invadens IP1]|uniref:Tetratricopeptide repeat protein, tpr, putative n=1 Tax=Entamoeba invadens IP1 TaxID=370355 RepID=A0A0A1U6G3_ENTIV|nr:tetratricopeptide repeat protein, tpr, putative [Entamoeba invadens IP1]ELP87396.1 tetratricopeptide repeat protein, tpr, putative [Entamoeba invadens IP1]|eukprot:XP_004254167.1 tetratricopeptide repeat protein, tpr, putative [Entamoeba invadens IP1]